MSRRIAIVAATLALLAGCGGSSGRGVQTPSPSPSPTGTGTTTETPVAGPRAAAVVYSIDGDLSLYDVPTDAVRRLTSDGPDPRQWRPAFRDSNTISYLQDGTVFDLDTSGGPARKVFKEGDDVRAFAWSPDGKSLAAIVLRGSSWRLSVLTPADGKVRDIKTVALGVFGRGGIDGDETRLAWSPDGAKIAVVDTGALEASAPNSNGNTMLVVGTDGSSPIPPRRGTFARWSPDGTTIYYTEFGGTGRLFAVEVATAAVTTLAATPPVRRPSPAPVGALIAFDDGNPATATLVFNAATGVTRKLGSGLAPLWLAADTVMVTATRPCANEECFEGPQWMALPKTSRLTLDGIEAALKATSTLDADVRYG
jgi:WD40 repeat protein